jgi:polyisoprenoid-binding protein YceI
MSSLKASVTNPRMVGALKRSLCAVGFSLAVSTLSFQAHAGCQYMVDSQWGNGFAAKIRITSNYNAVFSGTNPYSASNLSWNKTIQPGQYVEFGVQGTKGAGAAEIPTVTGAACGTAVSSSRSSSSAAATAAWTLSATDSYLNFITTKNTHNVEVHNFTGLTGEISSAGVATLTIDLNSVNTGVALRDQRMKDLLFETATYPTATVTLTVPAGVISGLAVGQDQATDVTASLNLHGVTGTIATKVSVQKLSNSRILVQTLAPVLVKAGDYSLTNGVEALRAAVGIASISVAVPVDFALVFDAR